MSDATPPPPFGRRGPRDRSLRAGDADRDAVAEILREHHIAGRLGTDELDERLERCMAARTFADLDALLSDLPSSRAPYRSTGPRLWRARPWPLLLSDWRPLVSGCGWCRRLTPRSRKLRWVLGRSTAFCSISDCRRSSLMTRSAASLFRPMGLWTCASTRLPS